MPILEFGVSLAGLLPANTVAPAVTGTAAVGSTLTSTTGTWSNTPVTYTYLWKHGDNSAAASTATASTYVPAVGDVGFTMKCQVTATNAAGSAAATSAATAAVALAGEQLLFDTTSDIWVALPNRTVPATANDELVEWWDDKTANARNWKSNNQDVADVFRPYYKTVEGPGAGPAVYWNGTNSAGMYVLDGSFVASKTMTLWVVCKMAAAPVGGNSLVIGRGENANYGFLIGYEATTGKIYGQCPMTDGVKTIKTATDAAGGWKVVVYSIGNVNGANRDEFLSVTGQTQVTGSHGDTALTFDAADVAAWIGDCTSNGTGGPAFGKAKWIAAGGIANQSLTAAETEALKLRLQTKYGV